MSNCRHTPALAQLRTTLADLFADEAREDEQPIDMATRLLIGYRALLDYHGLRVWHSEIKATGTSCDEFAKGGQVDEW